MSLMDLTLQWLMDNHIRAHYFGLGFIQVKIDETTRVHFYHPKVPAFVEEPHDHRYDFISTVLRGSLLNTIWRLGAGWDVKIEYETCTGGDEEVPPGTTGQAYVLGDFTVHAGSGYHMNADTFHTVTPDFSLGPCVTMIRRSLPHKQYARVVRLPGSNSVCPFSRPIGQEELWAIVGECLSA